MRRRSFDKILSITGFVLAIVLAIAGGLLLWGGMFAQNTVHDQLAAQQITFSAAAELPPELQSYAGQQVTTGGQAKAYSDLIAEHLTKVADGKTYSEVSAEWIAGGMKDATLAQQRTTLFMGETLRGLLLNTYAFSIFGMVALIAGIVALIASVVLLALSIVGFMHGRHTPEDVLVGAPHVESIPA
jgi:hypothetical protein